LNPADWLKRTAQIHPTAPALLRGETVIADYAQFVRNAAAVGGMLRAKGVGQGERVAVFMKNCTEYLEVLYGAWFAGAAVVPINYKLHHREVAWILEDAQTAAVFLSDEVGTDLAALVPPCVQHLISVDAPAFDTVRDHVPLDAPASFASEDLLWLFYTSGTTGKPKGVQISAANILAMVLSYFTDVDEVYPGDAAFYAAPMSHGAGLYNFMHVIRASRHVVPESGGFDAAEILSLAPRLGSVSMFAAPTMVRRLVNSARAQGCKGEGIRTIVYGGGPMYLADIIEAVEVMGPRFVQIYGQGESPMTITALSRDLVADRTHRNWRGRLASVGRAFSSVEVCVADENGHALPNGEIGEILVKGITVMKGYWQNPGATAATIRDGWLWTGDMGAMDVDGFITLHDRSKDVIISGGTNIYPREVEEALLLHADVSEVAVVGRKHPDWGEEVVAFVVAAPGTSPDAAILDTHCLNQIARFKRPKDYIFTTSLPKNNYGKVLKTELRRQLEDRK
jgi:acyl-CoA synthetase (AMP-forming)/AMP-acid ligase II